MSRLTTRPLTGIKGSMSQDGGKTVRVHKKAAISVTKSAVIDSGTTFEKLTDNSMVGNKKYRLMQLIIGFRQAAGANLTASHGTAPVDGYREFFFGLAKPGNTDHPQAVGEEDQQVVGLSYANANDFVFQFPNGEYQIVYDVDIPDDFDKWLFDSENGISIEIHSTDSPVIGQDSAGTPIPLLEVEIDAYLVQV